MTRVLVTGAAGLLGSRVASVLAEAGADVVRTARRAALDVVVADLYRADEVRALVRRTAPDVVVHLAGGHAAGRGAVYAANVLPTVHLVEAVASHAPTARLVVAGSAAEYGEGAGVPLSEDAPCRPVNDYGRAKLAQTEVARALAIAHGLDLLVVRPFNVVAHDLPVAGALGNLRRQLLVDTGPVRRVVCGRTDVLRDYVVADDVAGCLAELVLTAPSWEVLNLCSGTGVALQQVIEAAAAALDVEVELVSDPALVALPAPDVVVGDPGLLASWGLRLDGTVPAIVQALLSGAGPGGAPPEPRPPGVGGQTEGARRG